MATAAVNAEIIKLIKGFTYITKHKGIDVTLHVNDFGQSGNNKFVASYTITYPGGEISNTNRVIPVKERFRTDHIIEKVDKREVMAKVSDEKLQSIIEKLFMGVIVENGAKIEKDASKSTTALTDPGTKETIKPEEEEELLAMSKHMKTPKKEAEASSSEQKSYSTPKAPVSADEPSVTSKKTPPHSPQEEFFDAEDKPVASSSKAKAVMEASDEALKEVSMSFPEPLITAARDKVDGKSILATKKSKLKYGTPFGTIKLGDDLTKPLMQLNQFVEGKLEPSERVEINLRTSRALEQMEKAHTESQKEAAVAAYATEIRNIGRDILKRVQLRTGTQAGHHRLGVISRGQLLSALESKMEGSKAKKEGKRRR